MDKFIFNFPAIKEAYFSWTQIGKIKEEAAEIENEMYEYAYYSYSEAEKREALMRLTIETMDCIHACETLLRELQKIRVDVNLAKTETIQKNEKRNYY